MKRTISILVAMTVVGTALAVTAGRADRPPPRTIRFERTSSPIYLREIVTAERTDTDSRAEPQYVVRYVRQTSPMMSQKAEIDSRDCPGLGTILERAGSIGRERSPSKPAMDGTSYTVRVSPSADNQPVSSGSGSALARWAALAFKKLLPCLPKATAN